MLSTQTLSVPTARDADHLRLARAREDERNDVVAFIQQQFKTRFDAVVGDDTPTLYRAVDRSGQLIAAFGVRWNPETFFVRHYIGDVVETLQQSMDGEVTAHNVLELNHLCANRPDVLCRLAPVIARYFYERGVGFIVCTATARLGQFLARKKVAPVTLGIALQSHLPASLQGSWGSYYEHAPTVRAGDLRHAMQNLCGPSAA